MKTFLLKSLAVSIALILCFYLCLKIWGTWHDEWSGYNASLYVSDGYCNIAVIPVVGDITTLDPIPEEGGTVAYTNADAVAAQIRYAEYDPNILGMLVRIDSYGGYPAASEVVAHAVKNSPLPSVGLIREAGTSGGYLVATGADTIIASPFSDVGGIGITMSYLENWKQNQDSGLNWVSLTSAPFKDYGSPDKPLSDAERKLLERDLGIWHDYFVSSVAENRKLPAEEVARLADGSSMPGKLALEHKLIDALGNQETARTYFAQTLDMPVEDVVFCE
jgi:protease-4